MAKEDSRNVYLEGDRLCFRLGMVGEILSHQPVVGAIFVEPRRQRTYHVTGADDKRVVFRETKPARVSWSDQFSNDVSNSSGEITTDCNAFFINQSK